MFYTPSLRVTDQIERAFTYKAPRVGQEDRVEEIRNRARDFANALVQMTPESREQSLALTKLEEVVMFAEAAIGRNEG